MQRRYVLLLGGVAAVLAAVTFTAGVLVAQTPNPAPSPMMGTPLSYEQMHRMMDAMHGEGTSERMHAARGDEAERLMEQCAAMMSMMRMPGMMGR